MIKKVLKSSMLFVLIAGALNLANAQEKSTTGKPSGTNLNKKQEGGNHGQLFDKLDLDKNGMISKDEAQKSNNERFTGNFDRMDANKDGNVSREELKSYRQKVNPGGQNKTGNNTTTAVDANNDGKISRDEAYKSGSQYFINNFDKLDTNKDGFISKEEKKAGRIDKKASKTAAPKTDK